MYTCTVKLVMLMGVIFNSFLENVMKRHFEACHN